MFHCLVTLTLAYFKGVALAAGLNHAVLKLNAPQTWASALLGNTAAGTNALSGLGDTHLEVVHTKGHCFLLF